VRQFYFRGTVLEISNSYCWISKIFKTLLHISVDTPKMMPEDIAKAQNAENDATTRGASTMTVTAQSQL